MSFAGERLSHTNSTEGNEEDPGRSHVNPALFKAQYPIEPGQTKVWVVKKPGYVEVMGPYKALEEVSTEMWTLEHWITKVPFGEPVEERYLTQNDPYLPA